MSAAEPTTPASARSDDTVLYPKGSKDRPESSPADEERGGSSMMLVGAFLLAMAGGWLVLRRRGVPLSKVLSAKPNRLIQVEETKSLGNRQYLVVAGCEGRRFLLGVTQGNIQLLAPLDDADFGDLDDTNDQPAAK